MLPQDHTFTFPQTLVFFHIRCRHQHLGADVTDPQRGLFQQDAYLLLLGLQGKETRVDRVLTVFSTFL